MVTLCFGRNIKGPTMKNKYIDKWKLHRACIDQKISLRQAADQAGIRIPRIYALSGGYFSPRKEELRKLAFVLQVKPEKLLNQQ